MTPVQSLGRGICMTLHIEMNLDKIIISMLAICFCYSLVFVLMCYSPAFLFEYLLAIITKGLLGSIYS